VSQSEDVQATPLAAPFTLAGPAEALSITSGQERTVTLTLTTTEAAYPDGVVLFAGCPPTVTRSLGTRAGVPDAAAQCAGVPDGIAVLLPNGPITPTLAGVQASLVISTASTLPDGLYGVPIVARGGGLERQVTIQLQTQRPYFRLGGAPAGAILEARGTSIVQISTIRFLGTTDDITLALEDVPEGLQWAFGRTVIQPGEQTSLTLTDTELLGSGNYILRVIGNDGRVSDELTLVLIVREPGFDIVAQPSKGEGVTGKAGAAIYELILTSRDGWTTPVTLSVAGAAPPPGGALRLSSVPVPGTGGPTLTVAPTGRVYAIVEWVADTPPGLYLFTVAAVGGAQSSEVDLALHIAMKLKWYFPIMMVK
jgi:hypothetical protein